MPLREKATGDQENSGKMLSLSSPAVAGCSLPTIAAHVASRLIWQVQLFRKHWLLESDFRPCRKKRYSVAPVPYVRLRASILTARKVPMAFQVFRSRQLWTTRQRHLVTISRVLSEIPLAFNPVTTCPTRSSVCITKSPWIYQCHFCAASGFRAAQSPYVVKATACTGRKASRYPPSEMSLNGFSG